MGLGYNSSEASTSKDKGKAPLFVPASKETLSIPIEAFKANILISILTKILKPSPKSKSISNMSYASKSMGTSSYSRNSAKPYIPSYSSTGYFYGYCYHCGIYGHRIATCRFYAPNLMKAKSLSTFNKF